VWEVLRDGGGERGERQRIAARLRLRSYDGEPGPLVDMPENTPINPGVMRLGDWDGRHELGSHRDPIGRGFRGRIDEFIALSRALSQDEIGEMVTHGRPNFLWPE
jgi:hypothetical protein